MTADQDRILKLEEELAHLAHTNEELSGEILVQWKRVEELERKLVRLENRFQALEEASDNPVEITKPPHY